MRFGSGPGRGPRTGRPLDSTDPLALKYIQEEPAERAKVENMEKVQVEAKKKSKTKMKTSATNSTKRKPKPKVSIPPHLVFLHSQLRCKVQVPVPHLASKVAGAHRAMKGLNIGNPAPPSLHQTTAKPASPTSTEGREETEEREEGQDSEEASSSNADLPSNNVTGPPNASPSSNPTQIPTRL